MAKRALHNILTVEGSDIRIIQENQDDYISLTDIAKRFNAENPSVLIINWLRTRDTIDFLGVWEKLYNPSFNLIEFDKIRNESGRNNFVLPASRWITETKAVGIVSKSGRYGYTVAHRDIALGFCYWNSPAFQLYLIQEFQRLKQEEAQRHSLEWNVNRLISKANYRIHTEAVRAHLIPPKVKNTQYEGLYFATEADLINMAVFGITAKEWREQNPTVKGNMRDYATTEQLLVLANLESMNARLLKLGITQSERLKELNDIAIDQIQILLETPILKQLPGEGRGNDASI
ncbi:MAG: KilA-N domain-containing protein [Saprospiraceae bacterium]|nr:KilA-N domain-containing protein [Saprospiraceae bacterium]